MVGTFKVGDKVKPASSPLGEEPGVIVECQPACVYCVQGADGISRYYSGQQLVLVERGQIPGGDKVVLRTVRERKRCN